VSKPIKVVSIITRMNTGGAARLIDSLSQGFHESKVIDHVLVVGSIASSEQDFLENKNPIYRLIEVPSLGKSISLFSDIKAFWKLVQIIKTESPQIVHTHLAKAGLIGRIATRLVNRKIIIIHTVHGHLYKGYFNKFFTALLVFIEKLLTSITNQLIFTGPGVKAAVNEMGIGRNTPTTIIEPGIEKQEFNSRSVARAELNLSDSVFVIGFAGRLTKIKRLDRLFDAIEVVQTKLPSIEVLVAGGGELSNWCVNEVKGRNLPIRLLGWQKDTADVISASDLWVLTSDNEATPLSILEAAFGAVPSVACNVGDVSHAIVDGRTGLVVEPNPEALAGAILRLGTNPDLLNQMGTEAKLRANSLFTAQIMIDRHLALYQKLVS